MTRRKLFCAVQIVLLTAAAQACDEPQPAPRPEEQATRQVKAYVDHEVGALLDAARALCAAAPAPDEDGWSAEDRAAMTRMRAAWRDARAAYERIEGAIAILFPEIDRSIDDRYERTAELGHDEDPFDDRGFIGMHAIERILFIDERRPEVEAFERALFGYAAPRAPSNLVEARAFRDGLCARLVTDVTTMQQQVGPIALDPQTAWRGIQGSIEEQAEKVALAATGQDESRYANTTLFDMRNNLEGGRAVLDAYRPLIEENDAARAVRPEIEAHFDRMREAYGAEGDAVPDVPEGFDPDAPSAAHLATPYGRLFALLHTASDPEVEGSFASAVRRAGDAMGIPPLAR